MWSLTLQLAQLLEARAVCRGFAAVAVVSGGVRRVQRTALVRMCSLTLQYLQLVLFWMASGCVQRTVVRMCSLTLQQLQLVLFCIACGYVQRAARAAHYWR